MIMTPSAVVMTSFLPVVFVVLSCVLSVAMMSLVVPHRLHTIKFVKHRAWTKLTIVVVGNDGTQNINFNKNENMFYLTKIC
jgi:hypothetical protein